MDALLTIHDARLSGSHRFDNRIRIDAKSCRKSAQWLRNQAIKGHDPPLQTSTAGS
jgi:hypothetical protein